MGGTPIINEVQASEAESRSRFRIHTNLAPSRNLRPLKVLVERSDACINCGICTDACIYDAHKRTLVNLADPVQDLCRVCFRCVRECPAQALSIPLNKSWRNGHDTVSSILYQAEAGKIPVSGAGYRGKFAGPDFDGMWTDMSEIVRPTRDGIHGREYISTAVFLGYKQSYLDLARLNDINNNVIEIQIPLIFDLLNQPDHIRDSIISAAERLKTFATMTPRDLNKVRTDHAILCLQDIENHRDLINRSKIVQLDYIGDIDQKIKTIRKINHDLLIMIRCPLNEEIVLKLVRLNTDIIHLVSDNSNHFMHKLRKIHKVLVEHSLRDNVTLIISGKILTAEDIPKSIICGADLVAVDHALSIALECDDNQTFPVEWGTQRIINLMCGWRDQLLEVLGAMGMREVRRLRGEEGRAMFNINLEAELIDYINSSQADTPKVPESHPLPLIYAVPKVVPTNYVNDFSKFKVNIDSSCISCGLCVDLCPYDVFERPEGYNKLLTPRSSNCIGFECEKNPFYCVDKCPVNAIKFSIDPTYEALGDPRWTADLIMSTYKMAESGKTPDNNLEYRTGNSGGGFDRIEIVSDAKTVSDVTRIDLSIPLNRRAWGPEIWIPVPWYGGGMSFGSVSLNVMIARAQAAKAFNTFTSTGEGGYPDELHPWDGWMITQIATGLFGVREDTIKRVRFVEFKYAQGAKPGLGGHLLADKNTAGVSEIREAVPWTSLFSPFPFHSVYSVEDHKKHLDWIRAVNPDAIISVKVSTPTDVDMVAVGSYYAGAQIIHLDGGYGGTGAAPDIAKKNIAMPIEYAIPKVHKFLVKEGIRDEVVLMASGGIRTAYDVAKAIALGADGVVTGTAELVAIECTRCGNCERGRGCPFGIATTDPELTQLIDPDWGAQRIINLFCAWSDQLKTILKSLGMHSIMQLRGRVDLLRYISG